MAVAAVDRRAVKVAACCINAMAIARLARRLIDVAIPAHGSRAVRIASDSIKPALIALLGEDPGELSSIDYAISAVR